jgi:hypothetical protein
MKTESQKLKTKRARVSLNLDAGEVVRGNPASVLLGKQEEQPARKHRPLEPKPKKVNIHSIRYDIDLRLDELRPAVEEVALLERVLQLWKEIK